jgi:hypothetical protein
MSPTHRVRECRLVQTPCRHPAANARSYFLTRNGVRAADIATGAFPEIDVDVVIVRGIRARREHRRELTTGGCLDIAQECLLLRQAIPAMLDDDPPTIGKHKSGNVDGISESMFGNPA